MTFGILLFRLLYFDMAYKVEFQEKWQFSSM